MLEELKTANENEQQAFVVFRQKYALENPLPPKPRMVSYKDVGIEFYLFLIVTVAAIVMTSLRTAAIFYRAASLDGENTVISVVQAAFAMLAVEGGLVVYAFYRAKQKRSGDSGWTGFGIVLTLLISMFAGVGQSISLISGLSSLARSFFEYGLVLLMGMGGSVVAFIGGHITGQRLVQVDLDYTKKLKAYEEVVAEYQKNLLAHWSRSDEYKVSHRELRNLTKQDSSLLINSLFTERMNERRPNNRNGQGKRAFDFITQKYQDTGVIPGPREIEREAGVSVGTASAIRKQWINQFDPHRPNTYPEADGNPD